MRLIRYLILSVMTLGASWGQAEPLTFGIVPQQSATTLAERWTPIMRHLSEALGREVVFTTAKDIPTFEARLAEGAYDIAYMNPYHYTVFHEKPGYQALAKQQDKKITGIFVVKKSSGITRLEELDGQKLAFPSPAAFAASVLTQAELNRRGIRFEPVYVSSHDSVYMGVSKGFFAAGGGVVRTLGNTLPEVKNDLNVLWTSNAFTPHAIATHPALSEALREEILAALINLPASDAGQQMLKAINFKGIVEAQNQEWDDVRALNIQKLQHYAQ